VAVRRQRGRGRRNLDGVLVVWRPERRQFAARPGLYGFDETRAAVCGIYRNCSGIFERFVRQQGKILFLG